MALRRESAVQPLVRGLLLILLLRNSHSQLNDCGRAPLQTRIVGGEDAPAGSWPWQASLQRFGGHVCGGSLINREWVMSAAHCFSSSSTNGWKIFLGRQNQEGSNPNEVFRTVSKIVVHPNYDSETSENDIALLTLSSPVQFTDYIRPVCLAASGSVLNNGTDSWVTGWGTIQEGVRLPFPQTLQEVEVPVLGNRQCNCLNGVGTITDNMICAGVLAGGKDSCQGDSGGPMVVQGDSVWFQAGVVSFGFGCARPNLPGVYSRVSSFQSWITSLISVDQPGFVKYVSSGLDADSNYTCPGLPAPPTPSPTILINTTTEATTGSVCGEAPLSSRTGVHRGVVQGGSWPWMVSLRRAGAHICGGTLISDNFILTSAQCLSSYNPNASDWTVFLGQRLKDDVEQFEVSVEVLSISVSNLMGPNIALLQLLLPVRFNNFIQPVCIDLTASESFPVGTRCWAAGWPRGNGTGGGSGLRDVETSVTPCGVTSHSQNICTHSMDLQQGDQGGALLCRSRSSWFQAAMVTADDIRGGSGAGVMTFVKTSRFGFFLKEKVGNMPSPVTTATGRAPPLSLSLLLLLTSSIASSLLLLQ